MKCKKGEKKQKSFSTDLRILKNMRVQIDVSSNKRGFTGVGFY